MTNEKCKSNLIFTLIVINYKNIINENTTYNSGMQLKQYAFIDSNL